MRGILGVYPLSDWVDGDKTFTTWGQDRIWLIEEEIIKRLNK
ncbi:MAG: hypothetical protein CM1200mP12_16830 [Gammaproteobacteria bacterium]|nr:MAG: hypothetical protein CM1200mP12_16830 [Gammaproteobacteria bacterium]